MTLFSSSPLTNSFNKIPQRLMMGLVSTWLGFSVAVSPRLPSQAATTLIPQRPAEEPLLLSQFRPRYRPYRPRRYRPRSPARYQTRLRPSRPRIVRPVARRRQSRLPWRPGRVQVRASTYRWGGLARGNACQEENIATALVPPQKAGQASGVEPNLDVPSQKSNLDFYSTLSERPIFWLYVADLPDTVLDFTLQDERGTTQLYSAEFEVQAGSGIIGITLPNSVPPLETGQNAAGQSKAYVWQVRIECDPEDPSKDLYLGSGIRRLSLEEVQQSEGLTAYQTWARKLGQANERERPDLYANIGIWQDALSQLAELRFVAPEDQAVQQEWEMLLQEVGFQDQELQNLKAAEVLQIFD